jgi:hypothetical protein
MSQTSNNSEIKPSYSKKGENCTQLDSSSSEETEVDKARRDSIYSVISDSSVFSQT